MENSLQSTTAPVIARQLPAMAQLYKRQQASEVMTRTLDKLLHYEAENSRQQLTELQQDLALFEQQYGMTSAEFYQRFQAGKLGDDMDYVEWASLVQMSRNLEERLELLSRPE